jgi:hypothetical protein
MRNVKLFLSILIICGLCSWCAENLFALAPMEDGADDAAAAKFLEEQNKEKAFISWQGRLEKEREREANRTAVNRIKTRMINRAPIPETAPSAINRILMVVLAVFVIFILGALYISRRKQNKVDL